MITIAQNCTDGTWKNDVLETLIKPKRLLYEREKLELRKLKVILGFKHNLQMSWEWRQACSGWRSWGLEIPWCI